MFIWFFILKVRFGIPKAGHAGGREGKLQWLDHFFFMLGIGIMGRDVGVFIVGEVPIGGACTYGASCVFDTEIL